MLICTWDWEAVDKCAGLSQATDAERVLVGAGAFSLGQVPGEAAHVLGAFFRK